MPGQALGVLRAVGAMQAPELQAMVNLSEPGTSPCSGSQISPDPLLNDPRLVKWDTTPAMPRPPPGYGPAFLQGAEQPSPWTPASRQREQESGSDPALEVTAPTTARGPARPQRCANGGQGSEGSQSLPPHLRPSKWPPARPQEEANSGGRATSSALSITFSYSEG